MEAELDRNVWNNRASVILAFFFLAAGCAFLSPASADAVQELDRVAQADSGPGAPNADQEGEDRTEPVPNQAKEKAVGFLQTIHSLWDGLVSWLESLVGGITDKVDAVFGFKKAEGSQAFFGTVFYAGILIVLLFVLAFVFNILKDMFFAMFSSGGKKPPRRRR